MTEFDTSLLGTWVGKQETLQDTITAAPVRSMAALFDRAIAIPKAGDPLPPLWHWLYFLPAAKQSELGEDGHP